MGFWDALGTAAGKAVKKMADTKNEAYEWKDRLQGKSVEELKRIAQTGSPVSKKMGACLLSIVLLTTLFLKNVEGQMP